MPYNLSDHSAGWREIALTWTLAVAVVALSCGIHAAFHHTPEESQFSKSLKAIEPNWQLSEN